MISFEYSVALETRATLNLENRITRGARAQMQAAVDLTVANIKAQFTDQKLADTIEGKVVVGEGNERDAGGLVGRITSTWPNMVHYDAGRPPGGMPPVDNLVAWSERKGIEPDPEKAKLSFAFAINAKREKDARHKVPVDVLVDWMNANGIVPSPDFARRSMAFGMAVNIARNGLPGHHYFAQGLEMSRAAINALFENVVIETTGI